MKIYTKKQVLDTLAAELEDATLLNLFPDCAAEQIRSLLTGNAVHAHPTDSSIANRSFQADSSGICVLYTDGASRGNPGKAGAGAVLFDQDGHELTQACQYLGVCTNNVAEYKALLLGLEQAAQLGCKALAIHLDSELIVRQLQGKYKVKNQTLKPLYQQVTIQLEAFSNWTVTHVPREKNKVADKLANQGIDSCR